MARFRTSAPSDENEDHVDIEEASLALHLADSRVAALVPGEAAP